MSAALIPTTATPLVDSTDEESWKSLRAEGVTASEVHSIETGGRPTWRRILDEKLNGSTFTGNRYTRRGHEREAFILAAVADMPAVESLTPNATLFAHAKHQLHRATPDAFLVQVDGKAAGVEVKSRNHGWDVAKIPGEVYDQCQWGMHVAGLDLWYQVTEVMGPDGLPTLDDPTVALIVRDQRRIDQLVKAADEFIAWRESGAAGDTLPDDELDVVRRWNAASARKAAAEKEVKALRSQVDRIIAANPKAQSEGWKFLNDEAGGFTYSVKTEEVEVLDEAAWKAAEPESYGTVQRMRAAIEQTVAIATELYKKTETKTSTRLLPVAPKGTTR